MTVELVYDTDKETEDLRYVCDCGCQTFEIRGDGMVLCAHCDAEHPYVAEDHKWFLPAKMRKHPVVKVERPTTVVTMLDSDAGWARQLKILADLDPKPSVLIWINEAGFVRTWGKTMEGSLQRQWLIRRLMTAYKMFNGLPDGEVKK